MGDIKLKIRHAKRGNERALDLSGFGMSELPTDLLQLTMLEILIVKDNKLTNLRKVESLPNLRVIDASNNNISALHQEVLDMYSLDTIYLYGNPIVNQNPQLAKVEGNQGILKKALEQYFGVTGGSSLGGLGGISSGLVGGLSSQPAPLSGGSTGGFSSTQPT